MNDAEIKLAVEDFKNYTSGTGKTMLDLATRYLELGGVVEERKEEHYHQNHWKANVYNEGRQDTLLAIEKRLEGLEDIIQTVFNKSNEYVSSGVETLAKVEFSDIANAIRESIRGSDEHRG